jgi:hypothetical protein
MVTHNLELTEETDRVVRIAEGRIKAELAPPVYVSGTD